MRYIKLIDRGYTSLTAFVMLSDEVIEKLKAFKVKHGEATYKELLKTFRKRFLPLIIADDFYFKESTEFGCVSYSVTLSEAIELEIEIKEWFEYYIDEKNWINVNEFNER
jgi:hypothetical protein